MSKVNFQFIKCLYLILGIFISSGLNAQTYIGPSIGRNYTLLESERRCSGILEEGFKNNIWFLGLRINQLLTNKLNVSFSSNFTKKIVKYKRSVIVDSFICDSINNIAWSYNQINSSIILNYN